MKPFCLLLAFFTWGCFPSGRDSAPASGPGAGLHNRLLRDQIEAYSKTLSADRHRVLLTVSVINGEKAPAFTISHTINAPRHLPAPCLDYDVINGYLAVFYDGTGSQPDTPVTRTELQGKIQAMGIQLSDRFLLYEARGWIIKMDSMNSKILSKEWY